MVCQNLKSPSSFETLFHQRQQRLVLWQAVLHLLWNPDLKGSENVEVSRFGAFAG